MTERLKLHNRARALRERAGLSQAELGRLIGKSQQQVDRLEEPGYSLRARQLEQLAAALGCHPFALLLPESCWPDPGRAGEDGGVGAPGLDRELLALVMVESESFLAQAGMTLAPAKKAELTMAVHDWMQAQGAEDAPTARADIAQVYSMMRVLIA